jgi:hypothetical protein
MLDLAQLSVGTALFPGITEFAGWKWTSNMWANRLMNFLKERAT